MSTVHPILADALAVALRIPGSRVNDIVREKRAVTPDTALRLSRYFGTSPAFWTGLQVDFDLRKAEIDSWETIEHEIIPLQEA